MISIDLPGMRLVSALNVREHWAVRAGRNKRTRSKITPVLQKHMHTLRPLLVVTITRVGPREFDDDALPGAAKSVRDEVAKVLRVNDATKLIEWRYEQEKGDYAVRITIEEIPAHARIS